jgi:hypothetical protein
MLLYSQDFYNIVFKIHPTVIFQGDTSRMRRWVGHVAGMGQNRNA